METDLSVQSVVPPPASSDGTTPNNLTAIRLYAWAIVGGMLPVLFNYYQYGTSTASPQDSPYFLYYFLWLGAGIVMALIAVQLTPPETRKQALMAGISAPALLGGLMTNNQLNSHKQDSDLLHAWGREQEFVVPSNAPIFSAPALVGRGKAQAATTTGLHGTITGTDKLKTAITGLHPRVWFVLVASTMDQATAQREAKKLYAYGVDARIIQPYQGSKYYGVAVGSWLEREEAKTIVEDARKRINQDAYVWRYPRGADKLPEVRPPGDS